MANKKNKTLLFGALSAMAATVAAGVLVRNKKSKNTNDEKNSEEKTKQKKAKNVYYTVSLNDVYSSYEDKTFSEEDMIEEIRKETSL